MDLVAAAQELLWRVVPQNAVLLAEKSAGKTRTIRRAISDLPQEGFMSLHYHPDEDKLWLSVGDWAERDMVEKWKEALKPLASGCRIEAEYAPLDDDRWVKIAQRPWQAAVYREKKAVSPTLSALATAGGYKPNPILHGWAPSPFDSPNPLTSLLASGLLGTGLGFGAGYLTEQVLPQSWQKGRLRRTGAVLGGLAGSALPLTWMGLNAAQGKPFYAGIPKRAQAILDGLEKLGFDSGTGFDGPWPAPIYVPGFNADVWDDPRVVSQVPAPTRAALSGAVVGASALRGGSPIVTPMDMARLALGMGTGYESGAFAGAVLGALTGAPPAVKDKLKQTGVYAGALKGLVPILFGQ